MPAPRWLARFNRRVTNRILAPLVIHLPWFGIVRHVGRRSGRTYRTPINIFRCPNGYLIALTYGPSTDWARNVLASGGCTVETRRGLIYLTNPRLVHDGRRRGLPLPVRAVLRLAKVSDFLEADAASGVRQA